jgi:hypothetical protein
VDHLAELKQEVAVKIEAREKADHLLDQIQVEEQHRTNVSVKIEAREKADHMLDQMQVEEQHRTHVSSSRQVLVPKQWMDMKEDVGGLISFVVL